MVQGHSAGPQRDVCICNNLKAQGKCFPVQLSLEVMCITWPLGSPIHILKKARPIQSRFGNEIPLSKNTNVTDTAGLCIFVPGSESQLWLKQLIN